MSKIIARVSKIQNCDSLHIVEFETNTQILSMMSLELNQKIKVGTRVKLVVKPTHIAVAKNLTGDLSYSNQLSTVIESLENGELLSSMKLKFFDFSLESIITLKSSNRMDLKVGDSVTALIKASELSICEILDD